MRTFSGGATRDTNVGKLSYVKALSPIVLRRYVQYLDIHRKQSDGSMREFNNWKQGIPEETYLDGLGRHFIAVWLLQQGFTESDNHGPVTLEDSLCAIIFGASGWLHELLKTEKLIKFTCPKEWKIELYDKNGWWVMKQKVLCGYLHKNLTLHTSTGGHSHKFGEAPGYWPTKEAAEDALKQYLEKQL